MQEINRLASSLHPLERKVLPLLSKFSDVESVCRETKLSETEVSRAFSWLAAKGLVELKEQSIEIVELGENGLQYSKSSLPEKKFLESLKKGKLPISEIKKSSRLNDDEVNICIGILRRLGAIEISKDKELSAQITAKGNILLQKSFPAEKLLKKSFPLEVSSLSEQEKILLSDLKSRKGIVYFGQKKIITGSLTKLGEDTISFGLDSDLIEKLTPQMLRNNSWNGKQFRRYDTSVPSPRVFGGKKQHYRRFLEEVREKFIALGFTEMTGPIVESEFWNMDSLFMPQFHSARDIHDAYYVKDPKYSDDLPMDLVNKVKASHEKGIGGSRGWGYDFDVQRTKRHVLRTQDTSISPRTLSSPQLKIPGKYFQMVRCFRYDVIDATHLADFNQIGGFVVEEGINFRHLVGLLKTFAKEFADTDQIKVAPAYFPFTEPSASLYAKHPQMGWIELAGSGIFRPEMTLPLGIKEPVIAWGVGVERLAMFKLGLKDIRQLFSHDLEFLRNVKVI